MVIDNNKNNQISTEDDEPTLELEPLSEEACAAMMLADDLAAETEAVSQVDRIEDHRVAGRLSTPGEDTTSEIEELRDELEFRIEMNDILQLGFEQQREQCRKLTDQVASLKEASEQSSHELKRSQKQLSKTQKKLAQAKGRERALLAKLEERGMADAANAVATEQDGAIEELRKENQELKDSVSILEIRISEAGEENEKLLAEIESKDAKISDYYSQLATSQRAPSAVEYTVSAHAPDARPTSASELEDRWVLVGLDDVIADTYAVVAGLVTIGSSPDSDIQIRSKFVSRHHAQLVQNEKGCVLADLSSTNGTFVNSRRINRRVLRAGDIVTIGKHRYRYEKQPAESIEINEGTRHGTNHHVAKDRHWNPRDK